MIRSTLKGFLLLALFLLGAAIVDQYVLGCSHNPTAPVVSLDPRDQAFQAEMDRRRANHLPLVGWICYAWFGKGGWQHECRLVEDPIFGPAGTP